MNLFRVKERLEKARKKYIPTTEAPRAFALDIFSLLLACSF